MVIKKQIQGLTEKDKKELIKTLNEFSSWLFEKKILEQKMTMKYLVDMPTANEDWSMKVDGLNISFNSFVTKKCSFEYFRLVVLHEFFHLVVQRVPNKEDAVRVKDDFGDELMKLIDIEADYFAALYHKEQLNISLLAYLKLYYEGNKIFSDSRIRNVKFERYIGSLLSVVKMFIKKNKNISKNESCDLYLPSISPIYTEQSLHVLVIRKEHIYFDEIKANHEDFVKLKECYTNIDSLTLKEYTKRIVEFVCKALKLDVPKNISEEIKNIN